MMENGWRGRRLLVVKFAPAYHSWTGSHRIAAAREASLSEVPCYVISGKSMAKYGVDIGWGPIFDHERFAILQKVGDEAAIRLMWQEMSCVE